ncbi:hypothetical protein XELAEV_18013209mg [Xenopus laevis]|uniref:Uncharacterized protein n=1 Tax=Xenopus laevis TaxID=8355 RepID=A0A974HZ52_XENLA|nr:hypothetical protein XELAEV_18013209mg [Xenopus laevis]
MNLTHQSWGQSYHLLQSSCPGKLGHRIHPVAEPEEEDVRSEFRYPQDHGLLNHCHCSFLGNHQGGEM